MDSLAHRKLFPHAFKGCTSVIAALPPAVRMGYAHPGSAPSIILPGRGYASAQSLHIREA